MLNRELLSVIFIHPEEQMMASIMAIFKKKNSAGVNGCFLL